MGSNPVWRASGHQQAGRRSGASLDTTRLGPTQCQRAQARHVHREVCERIGLDQPTGEGAVSERPPSVDGFRWPSGEKSVRRSVTFNPQGWETVFGRYPREVSRPTLIGRTAVRSGIDVLLGTQSGHIACRSLRLSFCPGIPSRSC